jgi:arylsulfatase A-like enzyme
VSHFKPGAFNDIMSNLGWMPTLLAAAGVSDVKEQLFKGYAAAGKTFKVHLDGYNFLPYLTGAESKSPREEFFYFSDDGDLLALHYDNWKLVFAQQRSNGTMALWGEPFVKTRIPWIYNLRTDPYKQASITPNTYWDWYIDHAFLLTPAQAYVAKFVATFRECPPRTNAASFTIDQVVDQLVQGASGSH